VFDSNEYKFSHGHAPRGRGYWAFRIGSSDAEPTFIPGSLSFSEAKKAIVRIARLQGQSRVFVCT
jgi:hypothetical protein